MKRVSYAKDSSIILAEICYQNPDAGAFSDEAKQSFTGVEGLLKHHIQYLSFKVVLLPECISFIT
ncbi:MAG: hypothetical protein JW908_05485 [Anaerolineales bacterium]|nr:hypothetical protein [Anaerolineales bacterium]